MVTSSQAPRELWRVGDLVLDEGQQRVVRGDEVIELPKRSFDLLLALVRDAPNVVPIDTLLARVWPGLVVNPETVVQRVKLLRDALDDRAAEPRYIAALRGRDRLMAETVRIDPTSAPRHRPAASVDPVPSSQSSSRASAPAVAGSPSTHDNATIFGNGESPRRVPDRWRIAAPVTCVGGIARVSLDGMPDLSFGRQGLTCLDFGKFGFYLPASQRNGSPLIRQAGYNLSGIYRLLVDETASSGMLTIVLNGPHVDVGEADGTVVLPVVRTAGHDGAVSVSFSTGPRHVEDNGGGPGGANDATPGSDFEAASGRFDWGDGDQREREIIVTILDDDVGSEFEERFSIGISNPQGGALTLEGDYFPDYQASVDVAIADDDAAAPTRPTQTSSSGSGGGGSFSCATLLVVSGLLLVRHRRRRGMTTL